MSTGDTESTGEGDGRKRWYDHARWAVDRIWRLLLKIHAPKPLIAVCQRADRYLMLHWQLDWYRRPDHETRDNERFRLPPDERLTWPAFWLVEVYTPSRIEGLVDALERTGWGEPKFPITSKAEIRDWIVAGRTGRGQGWRGLATVRRRGAKAGFDLEGRTDDLPDGVSSVQLSLLTVTASMTFVVAGFVLDDDEATKLDGIVRRDTTARFARQAGRKVVEGADRRKEHEVADYRQGHFWAASQWLSNRLPGMFAAEGEHPVVDLILTENASPGEDPSPPYMSLLGVGLNWYAWRCKEYPGVTLHESTSRPFWTREAVFTLSGKREAMFPADTFDHMGDGKPSPRNIVYIVEQYLVRGLAARLSIMELLRVKAAAISASRDLAMSKHGRYEDTSNRELRDLLLRTSLDVTSVTADIAEFTKDKRGFEWETPDFETFGDRAEFMKKRGPNEPLLTGLATRLREVAEDVADSERALRDVLGVVSSLNATIANLRLQRTAVWVAVVSFVVAVISLAVTLAH